MVPPKASTRSFSPTRPEPRVGSAPPEPSSWTKTTKGPVDRFHLDVHHGRVRMLGRVRQRLRGHEVRGDLDAFRQLPDGAQLELDGHGRSSGECPQGGSEATPGEDGRVNAACDLEELVLHVGEPFGDAGEGVVELVRGGPALPHGRCEARGRVRRVVAGRRRADPARSGAGFRRRPRRSECVKRRAWRGLRHWRSRLPPDP